VKMMMEESCICVAQKKWGWSENERMSGLRRMMECSVYCFRVMFYFLFLCTCDEKVSENVFYRI